MPRTRLPARETLDQAMAGLSDGELARLSVKATDALYLRGRLSSMASIHLLDDLVGSMQAADRGGIRLVKSGNGRLVAGRMGRRTPEQHITPEGPVRAGVDLDRELGHLVELVSTVCWTLGMPEDVMARHIVELHESRGLLSVTGVYWLPVAFERAFETAWKALGGRAVWIFESCAPPPYEILEQET